MKLTPCQGYTGVMDALQDDTGRVICKLAHSLPEYERIALAKAMADAYNAVKTMTGGR